jgi:hypothetical protein
VSRIFIEKDGFLFAAMGLRSLGVELGWIYLCFLALGIGLGV